MYMIVDPFEDCTLVVKTYVGCPSFLSSGTAEKTECAELIVFSM
jgi:hypothetical protein